MPKIYCLFSIILFSSAFAIGMEKQIDYTSPYLPVEQFQEEVENLLAKSNDLSNLGETSPLLNPLLYRSKELTNLLPKLLAKNANPNVMNILGFFPLHIAGSACNNIALEELLKASANPNGGNEICECKNFILIKLACIGNAQGTRLLLQYGANPNAEDKNGQKVLRVFFENFLSLFGFGEIQSNIMKILLAYGANPLKLNENETTKIEEIEKSQASSARRNDCRDAIKLLDRYKILYSILSGELTLPSGNKLHHDVIKLILSYENSDPYPDNEDNEKVLY
jgi:ankyrin repeat protein